MYLGVGRVTIVVGRVVGLGVVTVGLYVEMLDGRVLVGDGVLRSGGR